MNQRNASVFQSGEKVPVEGWYEVVGGTSRLTSAGKRQAIVQLTASQVFPNYDGRAICWRLLGNHPSRLEKDSPSRVL